MTAAPNLSLQKKSAARLAAVQCLYQQAMSGRPPKAEDYLSGRSWGKDTAPDAALLRKLLEGMAEHDAALNEQVEQLLTNDWKKERMSPLLLAVLKSALFELRFLQKLPAPVVINEYVTLAARFFDERETAFVNAALNAASHE